MSADIRFGDRKLGPRDDLLQGRAFLDGSYFAPGGLHGLLAHGFVRHSDGSISTFDADPPIFGTYPQSINPRGEVTGFFYDANILMHGFVRQSDGTITTFDAGSIANGTFPTSINPRGEITGSYQGHGFLQSR